MLAETGVLRCSAVADSGRLCLPGSAVLSCLFCCLTLCCLFRRLWPEWTSAMAPSPGPRVEVGRPRSLPYFAAGSIDCG